uniref:NADH dehydrogenase subunit 1 n=1 Tax=Abscondita chinensis TaxID=2599921 RepID=UPI002238385A|nr:NADH dehydrogenase subunit 1 [Abscondita chinensis]UYG18648.1 NADH dehydrogenase subunit 1 [Abscondita chinensis]UYG49090.1 NADH dehydrogenase subunit 1 [Abscondita chinensis]UYG49103.1 NADH dehydrogenase subunit 1 [Abscondita chinensis]UYG49116.1 NADH dehydrogenase subunit 1 [Abscondita chinensis]UYG49129.1 NADH dehydrogenase subunit 1 [Abscondita chinensis]
MFIFDYFLLFISYLILILCVLVGVAFLTLFERKILGYIQIRKGPNKVGFMGLIQPFSDAIKLFCKEQANPMMSNFVSYYFSPVFNLFLSLFLWFCLPFYSGFINFSLSFFFFLCVSSLSVYSIMIAGWSSNSNYSLLGSLRCVAQTISYEVSLAIILLSFLFLISSISIFDLMIYQNYIWFIFISFPLSMIWFVSSLAETNRTPFDFAEGESELVSGFNVEYSGGGFALIFMAEYASILFMSMLFVFLFLSGSLTNLMFFFMVVFLSFMFIWVRGTLPRFRYDKLMHLAWKSFLPVSLNFLMFFFGLKMLIFSLIF